MIGGKVEFMRFIKKGMKQVLVILTAFALVVSQTPLDAYGTTIQQAQDEKEALESKKADLEESIADLEKEKDDIVAYIEKLDQKLNELAQEIDTLKEKISDANGNLEQIKTDLLEAEETAQNQYDTMKKRIKYMYENGSQDYVEILLSASSISDLLNRFEYINKINEYDDNLLAQYEATKELIAQKQVEQEEQIASLEFMQEQLSVEQDGVEQLSAKKNEQLKKKNAAIASSEEQVSQYESQIEEQEALLEKLLEEERKRQEEEERKRREEEERKRQEELKKQEQQNNSNSSNGNSNNSTNNGGSNISNNSGFRWPLNVSGVITSTFGYRDQPTAGASTYHKGIDIAAPTGTAVVASAGGTVTTASYQSAAGNYIMVYHGNSTYTVYMHLSAIYVSVGDTVSKGQTIGAVGSTGVSTGPHLHFGVNINGSYVNPLNYVSKP